MRKNWEYSRAPICARFHVSYRMASWAFPLHAPLLSCTWTCVAALPAALGASPPSLCDTSAPRDTASRCARNTELHASPTRPPVCRPVTSCCIMYPSTSKPSDPCEPICNHFHLLYRRDSSAVSFAQAWTMFWGDCHRAQTVQALRRAGAAALARLSRRGPKSNNFPWAMNHDSYLRQLTQYG